MQLLEKYQEYRKLQVKLNDDILDKCVDSANFNKATEILGIVQNNAIVIESNYEKEVILDFNIYGNIRNGGNSVSKYIEQAKDSSEQEIELLAAMEKTDNLLYEVTKIDRDQGVLFLKEVLSDNDAVQVIDVGLSSGINENVLVFTRLIHLGEFSMTSGLVFCFLADHKQYLIKRSSKLMKKINSGDPSVDRFIAFFKLNRLDGVPTSR